MQSFLTNLVIFIVMGLGWYMKKSGRLTAAGMKDLNAILFSLLMPASFFNSGIRFRADSLHGWRFAAVLLSAYVVATAVMWVLSGFTAKTPQRRATSVLAGVRPNSVFIGLPVITLWLGAAGAEAELMYLAVCMPFFNTVPLLLSQIALNGTASRGAIVRSFINTFKNPIMLSGISGILVGALGWTPMIPQWAMRTLSVLGSCGNGMALLVIGASLAPENLLKDIRAAWPDMLMKLFIHPTIILVALLLFPLDNPILMMTAVVGSSIAPAFNCYVIARGFGMDSDYAATLVASATLISMVTMLFWMELVTRLFAA